MHPTLKIAAALCVIVGLVKPVLSELGPHAVIDVSQALLRAYKAGDADALHQLLAPSLQDKYPVQELRQIMARCRALTYEIDRFSLPSWGQRNFGFFGVYAETAVLEMILEIDEDEKIVHWVITNDVTSRDQQCSVSGSQKEYGAPLR